MTAGPEQLRVALDTTPALSGLTGVARYTQGLESGLRARGVDVRTFAIGNGRGTVSPGTRHLKVPLRVVRRVWALGLPLRAEYLTGAVDVVHSVDLDPPPTKAPLVVTIHDLAALDLPELHSQRSIDAARRRLRSVDRASGILADSRATGDALVRHGVERSRISVVHVAPHTLPDVPAAEGGVAGPYFLAVGELTLRKDYPTLFKAFARADLPGHRLVVVGPPGFGAEQVHAAAETSGLGDRLMMVGFASDRRLAALYAGATALVLTTREEGFGMPMVEAMVRGVPIIASDIPVVEEVALDAAIRAPVGDDAAFADAMEAFVQDDDLRVRTGAAALARSAAFSWEATVDGTLAAYRKAVCSPLR